MGGIQSLFTDPLVWNNLPKQQNTAERKYDMVFVVGVNTSPNYLAKLKQTARKSQLNICIIGDGNENSFLSKEILEKNLRGKIDENTNLNVIGHGYATRYDKNDYGEHYIEIYQKDDPNYEKGKTRVLLQDIKDIFEKNPFNINIQPAINLVSCQAGAVKNDAPAGIKLTMHSGHKYSIHSAMDLEELINSIKSKEANLQSSPYSRFMEQIVRSPETAIYNENGKSFKASAPKQPVIADLDGYLRFQLAEFLKFRRDKLGHRDIGTDEQIIQKAAQFPISNETMNRYSQLALIMEANRGSKDGRYVEKYVNAGVDVNSQLINGETPLYMAAGKGHLEIVKFLLQNGAKPNLATTDGYTPQRFAKLKGNTQVVELLKSCKQIKNQDKNNGLTQPNDLPISLTTDIVNQRKSPSAELVPNTSPGRIRKRSVSIGKALGQVPAEGAQNKSEIAGMNPSINHKNNGKQTRRGNACIIS